MKRENLDRANEITNEIGRAEEQLHYWENATSLYNGIRINTKSITNYSDNICADVSPETFTIVKSLNIAYWQQRINELQAEFEKL